MRSAGACVACRVITGGRSEPHLNSTLQSELVLSVTEGTRKDTRLPAPRAYSSERRTVILFALAVLRSVPHRKRHLRQAGSKFRGRNSPFMKYPD
jgi:hypothetical protein